MSPPIRSEIPADGHLIDTHVRARLTQENLTPAPPADRAALLRRLSLDLIGLPPTIDEIDAFLADRSPQAYEKQVERLLASPHYGERWARWWMDAARYADSDGYEKDLPRKQWPWRDWVINSLNRDLPYDQFIIEQIAGDLLPDATQEQRVATGFLRNSMVNEEGAILAEEFRMEGLIDRMDCVGRSVLGLTLACSQCHDHKYDPISQRDYYRMFAFLNNNYEAIEKVYSPEDQEKMRSINRRVFELEAEIKKEIPDWQTRLAKWIVAESAKLESNTKSWTGLHPYSAEVPDGICHPDILPDGTVLTLGFRPNSTKLTVLVDTKQKNITGLRLDALKHGDLIFGGPGRSHRGCFAISEMVVDAAPLKEPGKFKKVELAGITSDANSPQRLLPKFFRFNENDRRTVGGVQLLVDGDLKTAWSPDRGPRWRNNESQAVLHFKQPIVGEHGTRFRIQLGFRHGGNDGHGRSNNFLGRFRLSVTSQDAPKADTISAEVRRALVKRSDERTADDKQILLRAWAGTDEKAKMFAAKIDDQWTKWPEGDSVLNFAQRKPEHRRNTYILERGNWQRPTDEVKPGVPVSLHPLPEAAGDSRLAFAMWLVDRKSPTTARVIVNRVWQAYFGTGLVATTEDFGVPSRSAFASEGARRTGGRIDGAEREDRRDRCACSVELETFASNHRHQRDISTVVSRDAGIIEARSPRIDCWRAALAFASMPR